MGGRTFSKNTKAEAGKIIGEVVIATWDYAWSRHRRPTPESPCDTPPVAEGFACEDEENPEVNQL